MEISLDSFVSYLDLSENFVRAELPIINNPTQLLENTARKAFVVLVCLRLVTACVILSIFQIQQNT